MANFLKRRKLKEVSLSVRERLIIQSLFQRNEEYVKKIIPKIQHLVAFFFHAKDFAGEIMFYREPISWKIIGKLEGDTTRQLVVSKSAICIIEDKKIVTHITTTRILRRQLPKRIEGRKPHPKTRFEKISQIKEIKKITHALYILLMSMSNHGKRKVRD